MKESPRVLGPLAYDRIYICGKWHKALSKTGSMLLDIMTCSDRNVDKWSTSFSTSKYQRLGYKIVHGHWNRRASWVIEAASAIERVQSNF